MTAPVVRRAVRAPGRPLPAPARRRRGARAATVLAVAVVTLVLGGCAAGDDDADDGDAAEVGDTEAPSSDPADTEDAGDAEEPEGADPDDAGPAGGSPAAGEEREYSEAEQERLGEPVPEDELTTPGDREFTDEEETYLDGRVPDGADPGAVLEAGEEACARVGLLARHDPDGVVEALRDGEPAGAAEAIPELCPEHQELLDAAQR